MLKLSADFYRPLGNTGLRVPPIVFGCSALGNLYRVIPDVAKLEIVSEWFEHASPPVFIDTAGKYGAGLALEVLGNSLAKFEIPPGDVLILDVGGQKFAPTCVTREFPSYHRSECLGSNDVDCGYRLDVQNVRIANVDDVILLVSRTIERVKGLDLRHFCALRESFAAGTAGLIVARSSFGSAIRY
ncbi:MAG: aldo/keto reductase [Rhodospirillales bacterium]|nr:aldo/keto reductase [Rhodospirillales bacterium]